MATRLPGRLFQLSLVLSLSLGPPVEAQSDPHKVPKRPSLPADRDTNSATSYFYYGTSQLGRYPERAAASFYWASRLDPYWADPLYARYIALLLAQPTPILTTYLTHRQSLRKDPVIRGIDSLKYLALLQNPFVDRRLEGVLLEKWLERESGGVYNLRDLRQAFPVLGPWLSYTYGRFEQSAGEYAEILARFPGNPYLQLERALPLVALGRHDSALAAVRLALDSLRGSPDDQGGYPYESQPFAEYSLGVLFEQTSQRDSAQAAFERALLDDITFYPAHRKLGRLRLAAGDTVRALKELADAAALAPGDAISLFELGALSLAAGHADSALALLTRAAEAEPYFRQPHLTLGLIYDRSGFVEEAIREYRAFVGLAPRSMDAQATGVRERLQKLAGGSPP